MERRPRRSAASAATGASSVVTNRLNEALRLGPRALDKDGVLASVQKTVREAAPNGAATQPVVTVPLAAKTAIDQLGFLRAEAEAEATVAATLATGLTVLNAAPRGGHATALSAVIGMAHAIGVGLAPKACAELLDGVDVGQVLGLLATGGEVVEEAALTFFEYADAYAVAPSLLPWEEAIASLSNATRAAPAKAARNVPIRAAFPNASAAATTGVYGDLNTFLLEFGLKFYKECGLAAPAAVFVIDALVLVRDLGMAVYATPTAPLSAIGRTLAAQPAKMATMAASLMIGVAVVRLAAPPQDEGRLGIALNQTWYASFGFTGPDDQNWFVDHPPADTVLEAMKNVAKSCLIEDCLVQEIQRPINPTLADRQQGEAFKNVVVAFTTTVASKIPVVGDWVPSSELEAWTTLVRENQTYYGRAVHMRTVFSFAAYVLVLARVMHKAGKLKSLNNPFTSRLDRADANALVLEIDARLVEYDEFGKGGSTRVYKDAMARLNALHDDILELKEVDGHLTELLVDAGSLLRLRSALGSSGALPGLATSAGEALEDLEERLPRWKAALDKRNAKKRDARSPTRPPRPQ